MDEEDYWNVSMNKAFSFDDDNTTDSIQLDRKIFDDGNTSELNYEIKSNEIPLNLLISDDDLRLVLEEQTIKETPLPKTIATEDELKILRRQLQDKIHAPPASLAITKILLKKPYYLDCYKSLDEKIQLLDDAINSGDGDAILIVTLFLLKTLKKKLAMDILKVRPLAINHYLTYLRQRKDINNCILILNAFGRQNEVSMLLYEQAMDARNNQKLSKISQLYRDHFKQTEPSSFHSQLILNYINLLEWQHNQPNSKEILDKAVLESLYYASTISKWSGNETVNSSAALKLADIHKVIPSQFEWVVLNERARSKAWLDLETIFQKKSWNHLKSKIFSINMPLDKTILQLYRLDAPAPVLNYFLANVSDAVYRAALALKVGAERSVIDSYAELKDSQKLEQYLNGLKVGSETRFYGENILKNVKSKGK